MVLASESSRVIMRTLAGAVLPTVGVPVWSGKGMALRNIGGELEHQERFADAGVPIEHTEGPEGNVGVPEPLDRLRGHISGAASQQGRCRGCPCLPLRVAGPGPRAARAGLILRNLPTIFSTSASVSGG